MEKRRVVITGIGIVSPLGNSVAQTWDSAKAGKSGIGLITQFDATNFASRIAGEVRGLNPESVISKKEVRRLDRYSQLALVASHEAWESSGVASSGFNPVRFGCVLGVGMGGLGSLEDSHKTFLSGGPRRITPFLIPMLISNLAPGHIAIRYGLKGINMSVTSACASSTHAMGEAYRMIAFGFADKLVTGGTESTITEMAVGGFAAMKALSERNAEPSKASRPFDKDRDGFVIGEGAAIFIFEEYEAAKKRGANILAEVVGYGYSCDANHITAPAADGSGACQCMIDALNDAGLKPEQIEYVNAHGTSTPVGDVAETGAIKKVFGAYAKEGLMVSSTKSMTGHLLGAAGAIEAAFCALAMRDGVIPPTVNLDNPDPACDLDYVPHTAREKKISVAMSNSFGFGGTNASIILKKI